MLVCLTIFVTVINQLDRYFIFDIDIYYINMFIVFYCWIVMILVELAEFERKMTVISNIMKINVKLQLTQSIISSQTIKQ